MGISLHAATLASFVYGKQESRRVSFGNAETAARDKALDRAWERY